MENNIQPSIVHSLPAPAPGVTVIGDPNQPAPLQSVPSAPVVAASVPIEPESNWLGSVNWTEILVYTAIVTITLFGINHYRNQNRLYNQAIENQNQRIASLELEVETLLTPIAAH